MADDAQIKQQLDDALTKFQRELKELQVKLDSEVAQIITEAKQQQIDELKRSLNETHE